MLCRDFCTRPVMHKARYTLCMHDYTIIIFVWHLYTRSSLLVCTRALLTLIYILAYTLCPFVHIITHYSAQILFNVDATLVPDQDYSHVFVLHASAVHSIVSSFCISLYGQRVFLSVAPPASARVLPATKFTFCQGFSWIFLARANNVDKVHEKCRNFTCSSE